MRIVLQRVIQASVEVEEKEVGAISKGFLLLLGIEPKDTSSDIAWLIKKVTQLRLFEGPDGRMSQSLLDIKGEALVISQFTLHASTKKGTRPSFHRAAPPQLAEELYNQFVDTLSQTLKKPVPTGTFGAEMEVHLTNDGPVTLILDSKKPE